MYLGNKIGKYRVDIDKLIAEHFESMYTDFLLPNYELKLKGTEKLNIITIEKSDIRKKVNDLKTDTSSGPDLISPIFN